MVVLPLPTEHLGGCYVVAAGEPEIPLIWSRGLLLVLYALLVLCWVSSGIIRTTGTTAVRYLNLSKACDVQESPRCMACVGRGGLLHCQFCAGHSKLHTMRPIVAPYSVTDALALAIYGTVVRLRQGRLYMTHHV